MVQLYHDNRPSRIESYVAYGLFDETILRLYKEDLALITLAQNAQLRLEQRERTPLSQQGNWVAEQILYIAGETPKLVRAQLTKQRAIAMTKAHMYTGEGRGRKEHPLSPSEVERLLTNAVDFPKSSTIIPFNRFSSDPLTVYAFGAQRAQLYGEFLGETTRPDPSGAPCPGMPIYVLRKELVNRYAAPFLRQVWFYALGNDKSALGGERRLSDGGRSRAVRAFD